MTVGDRRAGRVHPVVSAPVLRALGEVDPVSPLLAEARVELNRYGGVTTALQRSLLEELAERTGVVAVLQLSEEFRQSREPLLYVLLNSDSPNLVIDKATRLTRYFHSEHRVRVVARDSSFVDIQHYSERAGPPVAIESLFVCSLHTAILDTLGCRDLRAELTPPNHSPVVVFADGRFRDPGHGPADRWRRSQHRSM